MRLPQAALLASVLLAPSLASAACTVGSVAMLKVKCGIADQPPASCAAEVPAMVKDCKALEGSQAGDASYLPGMMIQLKQTQDHVAKASAGSHPPADSTNAPEPRHDGGPHDAHGAVERGTAYQPEETRQTVQTSLADGNIKGADEGAKKMLDHGDQKSARQALDQIIKQDPRDPQARGLSAEQRLRTGDVPGAVADARIALQGDPSNESARRVVAWADSQGRDLRLKKGLALDFGAKNEAERGAGGAADDARRAAGSAQEAVGPAKPGPGVVFSQVGGPAADALAEARRYAALGDYARAQAEIDRALGYNAKNAEALAVRSRLMNKRSDFAGAIRDADAALSLDPENVSALLERGYAKYGLGRYRDALSDVERALAIDPLNAMGHLYRAMILERMDRAKEAVGEYMKAVELDASLKPLVDEALARLGVSSISAAGRAARRYWPLWAGAILAALVLLGFGFKRVIRPEWATPITPPAPLR